MFNEFKKEVARAQQWQRLLSVNDLPLYQGLIIEEGVKEYFEAYVKGDDVKMRDSLADTIVVATGCLEISSFYYTRENELLLSDVSVSISHYDIHAVVGKCLYRGVGDDFMDLISSCYSMAELSEFPIVEDLAEVNRSNYSKFCDCPSTVNQTQEKYLKLGVKTRFTRLSNGQYAVFADGQHGSTPDGKLMKGISYSKPKLKELD